MGATKASRPASRPWSRVEAVAIAPREWATTAAAGPWSATTAARAPASSRTVLRPGPSGPGSDAPWLGPSKLTTRRPAPVSGSTNASSCSRHPPQPCTRYTASAEGSPQTSPATIRPSTRSRKGRPGSTGRSWRARGAGMRNQRRSAQRAPRAGATRSRSANDRAFLNGGEAAGGHRVSSGGGPAGGEQQRLEGAGGPGGGVRVGQQAAGVVVGEHRPVQVVGELLRVGAGVEVALGDAGPEHLGDGVQPVALVPGQAVPDRARLGVELGAGRDEQAAAGQGVGVPGEPAPEQLAYPWLAAGGDQGGPDHQVDEAGAGVVEQLELERLLGLEVGEQPALGDLGRGGQRADGQPAQPDPAGHPGRLVEHRLPGLGPLGHAPIKARTFVYIKRAGRPQKGR